MDYKKAYEDALERAKCIYNENPSSPTAKFVCGQIFPELKESEDEGIRKELLEEIEFIIPHDDETDSEGLILPLYHARIDRYKSYLEKQKEQKPESCDCSRDEESYTNGIHHVLMNPEAYGLIKQQLTWLKSIHPHPAKSPLAEGVYYIKDGKTVAEYEDGVDTDRLLVVGKYCRFYLSMADLGTGRFAEAQKKSESLGEGWRCPDSFEGRTIGKMSDEIREKAAKIGAEHFENKGWFWTNEVFGRWAACYVSFLMGNVGNDIMDLTLNVLALFAFQN